MYIWVKDVYATCRRPKGYELKVNQFWGGGRKRFTIWVYLMSTPFSFSSTKMYDPKFRSDCLNIWIVKSYRDNLGNMHHQVELFTLNKKIDKTYVGRYENNHTGKAVFQERFLKFS